MERAEERSRRINQKLNSWGGFSPLLLTITDMLLRVASYLIFILICAISAYAETLGIGYCRDWIVSNSIDKELLKCNSDNDCSFIADPNCRQVEAIAQRYKPDQSVDEKLIKLPQKFTAPHHRYYEWEPVPVSHCVAGTCKILNTGALLYCIGKGCKGIR